MRLKPIQLNAPATGAGTTTRYAVSLGEAPEKTIQVTLTKLQTDSDTRVAALQLDADSNIITSQILTAEGAQAEFTFQSDGELWLTPLDSNAQAPKSGSTSFSFSLNDAELRLQEKGLKKGKKPPSISSDNKARSGDDV